MSRPIVRLAAVAALVAALVLVSGCVGGPSSGGGGHDHSQHDHAR